MNLRFHLLKGTFAVHEPLEMFIDVLPRDIFPVCHPLEVGKEIAFHLGFVKEAVVLVEDGRITLVTQYLRFFIMRALKSRSCWLAGLAKI